MNYAVITADFFIAELSEFFKTGSDFHKHRASAYQALLTEFGFTDDQIAGFIKDAKSKR